MTEVKLDSNCRQKVAYHAKIKLGIILLFGSMSYTFGWLTAAMFTIASIDRPYDVNSPAARYFITSVVLVIFIGSLFPFIKNLSVRQKNKDEYYCHTNRFYITSEYSLHSHVSGGKHQHTYYYADIEYNGEYKRLQLLNEKHWMYLAEAPLRNVLFVTSESGEIRHFCMAYDIIHSKKGETVSIVANIITIIMSLAIGVGATIYCMNIITDTLQYLP